MYFETIFFSIFKIVLFGLETVMTKIQKLHICSLYRMDSQFLSMGSGFRDMERFSKLPYLVMKHGHWQKFQKLHIQPLSTRVVKIELTFVLRAAVSEIQGDFQNCHIWA